MNPKRRKTGCKFFIFIFRADNRDGSAQPAKTSNYLDLSFKHLTIEDGLSQGMVNAIYQDRQGFMWFGTKAGLNRFGTFLSIDPAFCGLERIGAFAGSIPQIL